jgi:catechol 2,3-dioxygenase-like lactoylglutathione lyase family enzyme
MKIICGGLTKMKLNHLAIGTQDIKASQGFYETFFDFEKKFDQGRTVFLENQRGDLLALTLIDDPIESPKWLHFGFMIEAQAKVLEMYERMKLSGIELSKLDESDGKFSIFYASDPGGGQQVEVSWWNYSSY